MLHCRFFIIVVVSHQKSIDIQFVLFLQLKLASANSKSINIIIIVYNGILRNRKET